MELTSSKNSVFRVFWSFGTSPWSSHAPKHIVVYSVLEPRHQSLELTRSKSSLCFQCFGASAPVLEAHKFQKQSVFIVFWSIGTSPWSSQVPKHFVLQCFGVSAPVRGAHKFQKHCVFTVCWSLGTSPWSSVPKVCKCRTTDVETVKIDGRSQNRGAESV